MTSKAFRESLFKQNFGDLPKVDQDKMRGIISGINKAIETDKKKR